MWWGFGAFMFHVFFQRLIYKDYWIIRSPDYRAPGLLIKGVSSSFLVDLHEAMDVAFYSDSWRRVIQVRIPEQQRGKYRLIFRHFRDYAARHGIELEPVDGDEFSVVNEPLAQVDEPRPAPELSGSRSEADTVSGGDLLDGDDEQTTRKPGHRKIILD